MGTVLGNSNTRTASHILLAEHAQVPIPTATLQTLPRVKKENPRDPLATLMPRTSRYTSLAAMWELLSLPLSRDEALSMALAVSRDTRGWEPSRSEPARDGDWEERRGDMLGWPPAPGVLAADARPGELAAPAAAVEAACLRRRRASEGGATSALGVGSMNPPTCNAGGRPREPDLERGACTTWGQRLRWP